MTASPYRSPGSVDVRKARRLPFWIDVWLTQYRWYRQWCGGHWERWWIDGVFACLWLRVEHGDRPGLGFGSPTCEDWQ